MMEPIGVGIIGCGNISSTYLKNLRTFPILRVLACADIDLARAEARAAEFGVPRACGVPELLADPAIDLVVNLTTPAAHTQVGHLAAMDGKSFYSEKPLALTFDDGRVLLKHARQRGAAVGCAPDTFLGAGLQTCRELLDAGAIGRPIGAAAFMTSHGHEGWHPDPAFYYQPGGGPMFDMGPYYLTALVALLGPVRRVGGSTARGFEERIIGSEPKRGQAIAVEVPTHVTGSLDFASGVLGTITTSFDVWAAELPRIEIYGTEGTLSLPDPNGFGGPVRLWQQDTRAWREVPIVRPYSGNSRGIGVADMAYAMRSGRPFRANGAMALHVLEIMEAIHRSSEQGQHIVLESSCERPAPLPPDLARNTLDE